MVSLTNVHSQDDTAHGTLINVGRGSDFRTAGAGPYSRSRRPGRIRWPRLDDVQGDAEVLDVLDPVLADARIGDDGVEVGEVREVRGLDFAELGRVDRQDFRKRTLQGRELGRGLVLVDARDAQLFADARRGHEI